MSGALTFPQIRDSPSEQQTLEHSYCYIDQLFPWNGPDLQFPSEMPVVLVFRVPESADRMDRTQTGRTKVDRTQSTTEEFPAGVAGQEGRACRRL